MNYFEQDLNYFGESTMEIGSTTQPHYIPHFCQLPNSYTCNTTTGSLHQSACSNSLQNHHKLSAEPQETIISDMRTRHASNKGACLVNTAQYSNIPFVQIHTTDVGPQRNSYGNSFRRPATNAQIIKSEPIKYETADTVVKESSANANSTNSTSLRRCNANNDNVQSVINTNLENAKANSGSAHTVPSPIAESTAPSRSNMLSLEHHVPNVYRCMDCHLLTLTERDLEFHRQHAHTDHGIPRRRVPCPANNFSRLRPLLPPPTLKERFVGEFVQNRTGRIIHAQEEIMSVCHKVLRRCLHLSAKLHLREDHLMTEPDVLILMNNVNFIDDDTIPANADVSNKRTNTIVASAVTNISIQSQIYKKKHTQNLQQQTNINSDIITTTTHNHNSNNNDYVRNTLNNMLTNNDLIVNDKNKDSDKINDNSNLNNNLMNYKTNNDYNSNDNIDSCVNNNIETDCYNDNNFTTNDININATISRNDQPKRRIYLRNVKYLREPRHACEQEEAQDDLNDNFFPLYTTPMNLDSIQVSATDLMPLTAELMPEHTEYNPAEHNNVPLNNNNTNVPIFKYDATLSHSTPTKHLQTLENKQKIKNTKFVEQNYCSNFLVNETVDDFQKENVHNYVGDRIVASTNDSDINAKTTNGTLENERQRPKIYIKNVDILKEPLLLPEFFTNNSTLYKPTSLSVPQPLKFDFMSTQSNALLSNVVEAIKTHNFSDATPMQGDNLTQSGNFITSEGNNPYRESPALTNYLSDNYCSQLDLDLSNMNTFISEPTPPPPDLLTSNSEHNMTLTSQLSSFSSELSNSSSLIADAMLLLQTTPTFDVVNEVTDHSDSITTTAIMSITTTTVVPTSSGTSPCNQKISIKNVEVLKEPQFHEPRGTLHLRTVDELNLMNKREVENLIAPNLDNTPGYHTQLAEINQQSQHRDSNVKLPLSGNTALTHETDSDLGDDLDHSIIKPSQNNNINSNTKNFDNLDTPQISLISMRDIDYLSDVVAETACSIKESFCKSIVDEIPGCLFDDSYTENNYTSMDQCASESNEAERAAMENVCSSSTSHILRTLDCDVRKCEQTITNPLENENARNKFSENINNLPPPLVAMSSSNFTINPNREERNLPPISSLPPLVPVSKTIYATTKRITVSSNFLHNTKTILKESKKCGKIEIESTSPLRSIRGRPYGSNKFLQKKQKPKCFIDERKMCTVKGCGFRFTKPATLDYHQRCHASNNTNVTKMICPECSGETYSSWNTLHTHLWRDHEIDMELYSCKLCPFKTPVYSRLANTHMKIHYDERAYNCEQCSKTFKNSKQLKNHRRWHRLHTFNATNTGTAPANETNLSGNNINTKPKITKESDTNCNNISLHRCNNCNAVFSQAKSLRRHCCKNDTSMALKCHVCDRCFSSKCSLRLHAFSHEPVKRLKCLVCNYMSNDHNAFRRHTMMHNNLNKYECPYCSSKFIQSIGYQKHIQQKHEDKAPSLVHKCTFCSYSTINAGLFKRHLVKHSSHNMKTPMHEAPPLISITISKATETKNHAKCA